MSDGFVTGVVTSAAIAAFLYGLAGILVLLDDENPGWFVRLTTFAAASWPIGWALWRTFDRALGE